MVCEFGREVSLKFEKSGITAHPSDFDMRFPANEYDHGRAKFSESAGKVISQSYLEAEPVTVLFDEERSDRFYVPPETFTFRRQLDRPTEAELELHDPIQVLSRGTIEKSFSNESVGEIIEYIFENRDDPNNALTGFRFVNEDDRENTKTDVTAGLADEPGPGVSFLYDVLPIVDENELYTGFEFEGISPLAALARVLDEFELNYKVETDGTAVFGRLGHDGDVYTVSPDDNDFTLSRYDVTQSANRTDKVLLRGPYNTIKTRDEAGLPSSSKLRPYATAEAIGLSGDSLELEAKGVKSLSDLRTVALRALIQELMDDVNGTLTIDGLASPSSERLAGLDVGDHLVVQESVKEQCGDDVVAGVFLVTSLHHKAGINRPWTVRAEVSQIAFPDTVETNTFYYDPSTDQRFDSIEAFNEYNDGPEGVEAYLPL